MAKETVKKSRNRVWAPRDPHVGGIKVPEDVAERVRIRIEIFANQNYGGKFIRLGIRFRGQYCYIDAYTEPEIPPDWPPKEWHETREQSTERLRNTPTHLCRLRYFGNEEQWSLAFFTYSNEKYSPCVFPNGTFYGTPEEGFGVGATYLIGKT